MDEQDNIIVLTDENGEEDSFEYLDTVEYEGMEYVVLTPFEDEEEDTSDELEVVILRILHEENGDDSFVSEENGEIVEAVFQIFKERYEEAEDDSL